MKEIFKLYTELLKEVKFFEQDLSCTTPWFYDTVVENREELQKFLKENKSDVWTYK
ncbi:MAG: hypothetical protein PHF17_06535 [Arcobacteraceae bacterium]|nr:hypothetical protein [Arcobacteraceae bacterium]